VLLEVLDSQDQKVRQDLPETLGLLDLGVLQGLLGALAQVALKEKGGQLDLPAQQVQEVTPAHRETLEPLVDSIISQKNMC
jgi:hypothetical protein